ncbi:hypothetical protein GCM10012284_18400 [Mangrovihabitans endophyticus]|uniref:Uncharacterized protein n=1 Tax=Mangrovihabitans endophyticus TaxID=1751298 RepID=A0A8J3FNV2_9ACTN|nr:hypothetical protein GCM10012284_18400 [Mangrovihabitans endophyticus]
MHGDSYGDGLGEAIGGSGKPDWRALSTMGGLLRPVFASVNRFGRAPAGSGTRGPFDARAGCGERRVTGIYHDGGTGVRRRGGDHGKTLSNPPRFLQPAPLRPAPPPRP